MDRNEAHNFYAEESSLNMDDYLVFEYWFETTGDPRTVAAALASEQSTAQWRRPGVDEDFRPKHAAKVVYLEILGESDESAFGALHGVGVGRYVTAKVRLAHPHANFGDRVPNLLTAAMGEGAFFCNGITSIKLTDIEFPNSYLEKFNGPRFGTPGIRRMLKVYDRPLFFGVVKPNIGLDPESFAEIAYEAWVGGLDAAKDDEMLADPYYSPLAGRTRVVGKARIEAEQATGEPKIFIANVTDEIDRIGPLCDIAVANGANAVMLNVMAVGLSATRALVKNVGVPVIAHFDCIAPMSRHPFFGVSTKVLTKLQRMVGCDAIIMPGFGERMMTPDDEVIANADCCSQLLGHVERALPVPGGSDWAGTLPLMYEKLRTLDFAMVPGRGVFGHPMGPRAGAASLRQAWEAIVRRIELGEWAADHVELQKAIEAFGIDGKYTPDRADDLHVVRGYTGASLTFEKH